MPREPGDLVAASVTASAYPLTIWVWAKVTVVIKGEEETEEDTGW